MKRFEPTIGMRCKKEHIMLGSAHETFRAYRWYKVVPEERPEGGVDLFPGQVSWGPHHHKCVSSCFCHLVVVEMMFGFECQSIYVCPLFCHLTRDSPDVCLSVCLSYHGTHMMSVCLLYVCLDFSGMWSHLIRDSPDVFLSFVCHLLSVCLDFSRYKVSGLTLSGASNCTFLRLSRSSCRPSGFPSFSRGIGLKIYLCSWAENIYVENCAGNMAIQIRKTMLSAYHCLHS